VFLIVLQAITFVHWPSCLFPGTEATDDLASHYAKVNASLMNICDDRLCIVFVHEGKEERD